MTMKLIAYSTIAPLLLLFTLDIHPVDGFGIISPIVPIVSLSISASQLLWMSSSSATNDIADNEKENNDRIINRSYSDDSSSSNQENLFALFRLAASTGRGEFATKEQKGQAMEYIRYLEQAEAEGKYELALMQGTWELIYSNTQLFRSSPFFMAGRETCTTPEQAKQYDWFCDMHRGALAISSIGAVRQIVSENTLVSEFEVKAGAVPFLKDFLPPVSYSGGLPVTIDGAIVSTADITQIVSDNGNNAWEIFMDTVEIKGSNVPGLRQILDNGISLQSRSLSKVLEDNIDKYNVPKPIFETTYLSDTVRISRDIDGKVFVYGKTNDNKNPTDYSETAPSSDLGITRLFEGFSDSILSKIF